MIPLLPEMPALPTLPAAGPGLLVPATEGVVSDFAALLGAALPSANEKPPVPTPGAAPLAPGLAPVVVSPDLRASTPALLPGRDVVPLSDAVILSDATQPLAAPVPVPSLANSPALAPALEPASQPALPLSPRLTTGKNLPPPGGPLPPQHRAEAAAPEALPGAALISPAVETVKPEEAAVRPAPTPTAALVKRVAAPLAVGRATLPAPAMAMAMAMEPTKPDGAPEVPLVAEASPAKMAAPPQVLRSSVGLAPPRVPESPEGEVDEAAPASIPAAPPAALTQALPRALAPVLPEALPGEVMIDFTPEGLRTPVVSVSSDEDQEVAPDRSDPAPEVPALSASPAALALPPAPAIPVEPAAPPPLSPAPVTHAVAARSPVPVSTEPGPVATPSPSPSQAVLAAAPAPFLAEPQPAVPLVRVAVAPAATALAAPSAAPGVPGPADGRSEVRIAPPNPALVSVPEPSDAPASATAEPRRIPTPQPVTPPLPSDPALLTGLAAAIPDAAPRDDALAPQAPTLATSTPPPALLAAASPQPMPTPTDRPEPRAAPEPPAPQQQSTIDQVGTLREALRAQRPAMMLNHAEFGAVSLRLEAGGNDGWRAVLASRDPGFVPAIQTALAERVVAASSPAPDSGGASTGQQQSGAFQNGTGDHRSGSSPSGGQGSPQPYFGQSGSRDGEAAPDHRRPSTAAALAARAEAEDGGSGGQASAAGGLFA